MDSCPGHILESTKGIETKLGTHIDVNVRKYRRQEPYSYLTLYFNYLSLFLSLKAVFFVMYTSGDGLQVLLFIGTRHLGAFFASSHFLVLLCSNSKGGSGGGGYIASLVGRSECTVFSERVQLYIHYIFKSGMAVEEHELLAVLVNSSFINQSVCAMMN